ncbi:hypothetical protein V5735_21330 (plasmid) [Haladaptatus sp. SPP-AMP-3]|uniref:DUF7835 family putative zinc beta-ribbon protein n=1 Tax=Haladaptatus sp. SPP-AMP-3 TaxID=3121295 RepID=UPI003C2D3F6A
MTKTDQRTGDNLEPCENCAVQTPHEVSIEIRTESDKSHTAKFSREPYRVIRCLMCGTTTATRMNNA